MNFDPTGHFILALLGWLVVAAITAYHVNQTIKTYQYINENYEGWEKFGWMVSNTFLGYGITSMLMFDENKIDWGDSTSEMVNFDFSKNKNYNIYTSFQYAIALKERGLPTGRTNKGMWIELVAHHAVHNVLFGLVPNTRIADMGNFGNDSNAWIWEILALFMR